MTMWRPTLGQRLLRRTGRRLFRSPLARWPSSRVNTRGDRLDAQIELMIRLQSGDAMGGPDFAARRASMEEGCFLAGREGPELDSEDDEIAGCRVRWYRVPGATQHLVWLHGGGWTVGSLGAYDSLCHALALGSRRTVISVDYPLAPEHPWPAAVHAIEAVWNELNLPDAVIGGDSAGGNLAAAVSRIVDNVQRQFLLYPGLDATRVQPSHAEFQDQGLVLTRESMDAHLAAYAPEPLHPLASPLLTDDLTGLPPALIAVAGFDPLRDDGLRYAERLREAGVQVELFDFATLTHGFGNFDGLVRAAADAMDTLARALR